MNSTANTMSTINAQSNQLFQELQKLGWISHDKTLVEWESLWKDRPSFIAPEKKKKKKKKTLVKNVLLAFGETRMTQMSAQDYANVPNQEKMVVSTVRSTQHKQLSVSP
jgi:hypothetical protein